MIQCRKLFNRAHFLRQKWTKIRQKTGYSRIFQQDTRTLKLKHNHKDTSTTLQHRLNNDNIITRTQSRTSWILLEYEEGQDHGECGRGEEDGSTVSEGHPSQHASVTEVANIS